MDNHYEENLDLPIDPCRDTFIQHMQSLEYYLVADTILPEGRQKYGHWFAACNFRVDNFSALTETSTAPIMAPGELLEAEYDIEGLSRIIEIEGRKSIVRPSANGGRGCMVSMTMTFGSMTITGSDVRVRVPNHEADCARIIELLRRVEAWLED